ncbi:hypothetical protein [Muricoccus aerilatus]|uniref:hypothetical protein n=1 Tax=Muricoccus aerilatus TaxID=452982 RepID=UPI000693B876|nr:hypothetical protein [Roseomonas aerilata]
MLNSELAARLAIPGLPEWSGLVILLLGLLFVLAFVMMPFSVFGTKSRLDAIEAQLDEVQQEIRSLAMRLPEPGMRRRAVVAEDAYDEPMMRPEASLGEERYRDERAPRMTPPIPPPPAWPEGGREAGRRAEPRLGPPRR